MFTKPAPRSVSARCTAALLGLLTLVGCNAPVAPSAVLRPNVTAQAVSSTFPGGLGQYGRLIRLAHAGSANGRLLASFIGNAGFKIFSSDDDGAHWSAAPISVINDPTPPSVCCSTLFELPQAVGSNPAGTLFWAASFAVDTEPRQPAQIRIWRSSNQGQSWSYYTTAATGTVGLWEPEFAVSSSGQLVMYYSTEEHKNQGYNQALAERVSSDGTTWGTEQLIAAVSDGNGRPGMANVRRLPNGTYVLTFEYVNGPVSGEVHFKTSSDGVTWGSGLGTRIADGAGRFFRNAPTLAVTGSALLAVGQLLANPDGSQSTDNGRVIFRSTDAGASWSALPAPVPVPAAYSNYCPNYSSSLLVSADSTSVLGLASDYAAGVCTMSFGRAPLSSSASANASFETPALSSGFQYGPISGSSWTFGSSTGIQRNGSAFGSTAPDGSQTAFIQSGSADSCISQSLSFPQSRAYTFTFAAAQRGGGYGGQSFGMYIDGGGSKIGEYAPYSSTYEDIVTDPVFVNAGTHLLIFCGQVTGDHTAFIDRVRVN